MSKTSDGKCRRTSRLDVLRELRAGVVHREEHARHGQPRVQLALDERRACRAARRAPRARSTPSGPDDHAVRRDQRVDGERPERRRAVEQHVGVARRERGASASRRRRSEPGRRGSSIVAPARSGVEASSDRRSTPVARTASSAVDVAAQDVVEADALLAVGAEADGGVALRIDVDEQRLVAGLGDARGDVDRGGGLPTPPFWLAMAYTVLIRSPDASGADGGSPPAA